MDASRMSRGIFARDFGWRSSTQFCSMRLGYFSQTEAGADEGVAIAGRHY
jgi:hypothetical protein